MKDNHFLAFGKEFFDKHQSKLLWLLNAPLVKTIFRWLIFKSQDLYLKGKFIGDKIIAINPSSLTIDAGLQYFSESSLLKTDWENPDNSRKTRRLAKKMFIKIMRGKRKDKQLLLPARTSVFFTDLNYSKQLYFAFKPLWWLMHYWDKLFADKFAPQLSFSLATLEVYPDADPETTSVDGWVRQGSGTTWASVRDGAGNDKSDSGTTNPVIYFEGAGDGSMLDMRRGIFLFNTSALTIDATITGAVLSYYTTNKLDQGGRTPNVDIYTSTPASDTALANGDYTQIGTTSQTGSPITYANITDNTYADFTFNATGKGNVSKTGISKFGTRNPSYDVANSPGIFDGITRIYSNFAEDGSNKPKLVVTYTAAATGNFFLMFD